MCTQPFSPAPASPIPFDIFTSITGKGKSSYKKEDTMGVVNLMRDGFLDMTQSEPEDSPSPKKKPPRAKVSTKRKSSITPKEKKDPPKRRTQNAKAKKTPSSSAQRKPKNSKIVFSRRHPRASKLNAKLFISSDWGRELVQF